MGFDFPELMNCLISLDVGAQCLMFKVLCLDLKFINNFSTHYDD